MAGLLGEQAPPRGLLGDFGEYLSRSWENLSEAPAGLLGIGRRVVNDYGAPVANLALGILPGSGDVMAVQDSQRHGQRMADALRAGEYGKAVEAGLWSAAAGLGALPFVPALATNAGKVMESRSSTLYNFPSRTQRGFDDDYLGAARSDATGRLVEDIEGRPLIAEFVAGRRREAGVDEALRPEELVEGAARLTGSNPSPSPARALPREAAGAFLRREGPEGPIYSILYNKDLRPDDAQRVIYHEFGHAIDELAGRISTDGIVNDLRRLYDLGNGGGFRTAKARSAAPDAPLPEVPQRYRTRPEDFGYRGDAASRELMAEAIRAYAQDPNFIKSDFPKVAARIRQWANENPRTNRVIQFNTLAPIGAGGLLGASLAGAPELDGSR